MLLLLLDLFKRDFLLLFHLWRLCQDHSSWNQWSHSHSHHQTWNPFWVFLHWGDYRILLWLQRWGIDCDNLYFRRTFLGWYDFFLNLLLRFFHSLLFRQEIIVLIIESVLEIGSFLLFLSEIHISLLIFTRSRLRNNSLLFNDHLFYWLRLFLNQHWLWLDDYFLLLSLQFSRRLWFRFLLNSFGWLIISFWDVWQWFFLDEVIIWIIT